jgi:DnaJ-domain-containing protein 1
MLRRLSFPAEHAGGRVMINDSLRFVESILRLVSQQQLERAPERVRTRGRRDRTRIEREAAHEQERTQQPESNTEAEGQRDWWVVLEVSRHASDEEIRRSYVAKLKQYHPDRVNDLAPEIVRLAELRTRELNAAFAQAKQRA